MSGNEITSDQCHVHRVESARKAVRDLLDDHEILHDDVAEIQIHRDLASGADARGFPLWGVAWVPSLSFKTGGRR